MIANVPQAAAALRHCGSLRTRYDTYGTATLATVDKIRDADLDHIVHIP